ncbi:MAG: ribonuclease P protein component [Muribaculaceae bacterium]|nr:ribonuclease P protein component [Muribaculaceae bacterium]
MNENKHADNRMGKEEKLRLKTLVDGLFREGDTLYDFPLRMNFRALGQEGLSGSFRCGTPEGVGPLQMLVTVPKRKRRRAVDRVLLRRRIREAYRLNRHRLREAVTESGAIATLGMAFIYMHDTNVDYALIEKKMRKLLDRLTTMIEEGSLKIHNPVGHNQAEDDSTR